MVSSELMWLVSILLFSIQHYFSIGTITIRCGEMVMVYPAGNGPEGVGVFQSQLVFMRYQTPGAVIHTQLTPGCRLEPHLQRNRLAIGGRVAE